MTITTLSSRKFNQDASGAQKAAESGQMTAIPPVLTLRSRSGEAATRSLLVRERETLIRIAARHYASNIRVFGSVARGEDGPDSDIDLLVDFGPEASLLDLIALKQEIERILHRPADVVTVDGVSPFLRQRILGEACPL